MWRRFFSVHTTTTCKNQKEKEFKKKYIKEKHFHLIGKF